MIHQVTRLMLEHNPSLEEEATAYHLSHRAKASIPRRKSAAYYRIHAGYPTDFLLRGSPEDMPHSLVWCRVHMT